MKPIVEVKIKKSIAYFFFGMGSLLFMIGLLLGEFIPIVNSLFPLVLGFQCLKNTYFYLNPNEIVVKALIGSKKQIYSFHSLDEVVFENGKVYLIQNAQKKRVLLSKFFSDKAGWNQFVKSIKNL